MTRRWMSLPAASSSTSYYAVRVHHGWCACIGSCYASSGWHPPRSLSFKITLPLVHPSGHPLFVHPCSLIPCLVPGYPPFWDENQQALYEQIKKGSYDYPSPEWDSVTPAAKDLIDRMMDTNPKTRITVDQALRHPWIAQAEVPSSVYRQATLNERKWFDAHPKLKARRGRRLD